MKNEDNIEKRLDQHRTQAPEGFTDRVMDAIPDFRAPGRSRRPRRGWWFAPAGVAMAAVLVLAFSMGRFRPASATEAAGFHFELHAPGAHTVELLGTFNNWRAGDIMLAGPDGSGDWNATVELAEGRYEYIFLVDGERWVADPNGATHRPDGFGRENTVINYNEDDSV